MTPDWTLHPARPSDAEWLVALKARALVNDLTRVGVWSPTRSRERFLAGFHPRFTRIIRADDAPIGCIAVRPTAEDTWIEQFYLEPALQGQGIGTAVLERVLAEFANELPFRIDVLRGSAARRLYERHGFRYEREDGVDIYLVRPAAVGTAG